ncbi:hypothetical protein HMN09_00392300 [Mycena chlorophos]|uniref:Uncharacterized protein n=1 Tax=Mycena chlorophos TaxID=658473 RepID=A0A8H6TF69_MYCCL|nr:hypothetical protein HMN09_00392300 [Mycena chlorophos]
MQTTVNFPGLGGGTGGVGGASPSHAGSGGLGEGARVTLNFSNARLIEQDVNPAAPRHGGGVVTGRKYERREHSRPCSFSSSTSNHHM